MARLLGECWFSRFPRGRGPAAEGGDPKTPRSFGAGGRAYRDGKARKPLFTSGLLEQLLGALRWAALVLALVLPRPALALPAALELVREAEAHEAAHEDDLALRRYSEALAIDPTLGEAYLGLGALRLRMGDARESERVFDTALSRVPSLLRAWLGRGHARYALGARHEAEADLEMYVDRTANEMDPEALRELGRWYQGEGRPLAQLSVWRRLLSLAERAGDAKLTKEARLTVRALEAIVAPTDPVREPPGGARATQVRRGIARAERRRLGIAP
jgi:tetratricopeptide (TPR) repeat protein